MYVIKNYLTDEVVGMASRKEDAIAMISKSSSPNDPKLFFEKMQKTG